MTDRIDVHFHVIPSFYRDAAVAAGKVPARGAYPEYSEALALELMDRHGIAMAITSISQPGVHFGDDRAARALARRCNDYAAGLDRKRFGAFATLTLPDVDGTLAEIGYALDTLKMDGVCLFASADGKYLGDPAFDPVMAELDRRGAVAFVHPAMHASALQTGLSWPLFMLEYPFDTTRAAFNLVLTGTLKRYPRIRFILSHAGGAAPYLAWRGSVSPMIDPRMPQLSREEVLAGFRHFWYDTALAPAAATWGCLKEVADPSRIVFGSDWPFANAAIQKEADRDNAYPANIARQNALALFPRLAG